MTTARERIAQAKSQLGVLLSQALALGMDPLEFSPQNLVAVHCAPPREGLAAGLYALPHLSGIIRERSVCSNLDEGDWLHWNSKLEKRTIWSLAAVLLRSEVEDGL